MPRSSLGFRPFDGPEDTRRTDITPESPILSHNKGLVSGDRPDARVAELWWGDGPPDAQSIFGLDVDPDFPSHLPSSTTVAA